MIDFTHSSCRVLRFLKIICCFERKIKGSTGKYRDWGSADHRDCKTDNSLSPANLGHFSQKPQHFASLAPFCRCLLIEFDIIGQSMDQGPGRQAHA